MIFKGDIFQIICILASLLAAPRITNAETDIKSLTRGMESFAHNLFGEFREKYPEANIICSPFSIHTLLTMVRMGAEGETERELNQVLGLSDIYSEDIAENYHDILKQYENSSILKIANKIYPMDGYCLKDKFDDLLTKHFYSSVDYVNFADNVASAQTINTWVEGETNHLIKDLIDPNSVNGDTRLVLVNAIHFKGNWKTKFPKDNTSRRNFYIEGGEPITIPMMQVKANFKNRYIRNLNIHVLEMPYENSDLSMLVIVPYYRKTVAEIEKQLKDVSLSTLTEKLEMEEAIVQMPKFKAEFKVDLVKTLKQMGIKNMFTESAEFSKMLELSDDLYVSSVIHKTVIEINEEGTEAAAASEAEFGARMRPTQFYANRPFIYIIKNEDNMILFKGVFTGKDGNST